MATTQRERNAAQAREKMDARCEAADGAAGWVAERAGQPTKIRTAFQPPVRLSRDPAKAKDDTYVDRKYDEVQQSLQDGMDALARRRAFPVFG